jgi:hypothetical protein
VGKLMMLTVPVMHQGQEYLKLTVLATPPYLLSLVVANVSLSGLFVMNETWVGLKSSGKNI